MANHTAITFSIVLLITISSVAGRGMLGGRTKISDVETNQEVQDMGRYSVEEHNRKNGQDLTFSQVVEAEKQVVAGMKYYLKIETFSESGGGPKLFEAVVEVKPWMHSKKLLKFSPETASLLPVW